MTRPEWIFFGMGVELCAIWAAIVVLATGAILTVNLINFRSAATTTAEMLQERRRIVNPSLMMIGAAAGLWALLGTVYYIWWFAGDAHGLGMLFRALYFEFVR